MRLSSFIDLYVSDHQDLHIECIGVGDIVFDGTKDELLAEYNDDSDPDILWLWVHLVEAVGDTLFITIQY